MVPRWNPTLFLCICGIYIYDYLFFITSQFSVYDGGYQVSFSDEFMFFFKGADLKTNGKALIIHGEHIMVKKMAHP